MGPQLTVDLFCGGGGVSTGIELALGRPVDVAVNHDEHAIAMHRANHPATQHYRDDVFRVQPWRAVRSRRVKLLWQSPDCTHFSKARGSKPKKKEVRGLATVAVEWARSPSAPLVIGTENVVEFLTWGPLYEVGDVVVTRPRRKARREQLAALGLPPRHDAPSRDTWVAAALAAGFEARVITDPKDPMIDRCIPERKGELFQAWVRDFKLCGYVVEWRVINCADFGDPTSRKRLFVFARCDGKPIVWPEPTHGPGRPKPWATAAQCVDWSIGCPSIFTRTRELAAATRRRIALGILRYVLLAGRPFIVNLTHGARLDDLDAPFKTITAAHRGEKALVEPTLEGPDGHPFVVRIGQQSSDSGKVRGCDEPLSTVVSKNEHVIVAPTLVQTGYGERKGQAPRVLDLQAPLGTVVAGGQKHGLVETVLAPVVVTNTTGNPAQPADRPLKTITSSGNQALAAAFLSQCNTRSVGQDLDRPLPTVTGQAKLALAAAFLAKHNGTTEGKLNDGQSMADPMPTVTGKAPLGPVAVHLDKAYSSARTGVPITDPMPTVTAGGGRGGGHLGIVETGLSAEPSAGAQVLEFMLRNLEPKHLPKLEPFIRGDALVLEVDGTGYVLSDIGLRMFSPRELARAHSFPEDHILTGTKSQQVERIGRSVPILTVAAHVAAQFDDKVKPVTAL